MSAYYTHYNPNKLSSRDLKNKLSEFRQTLESEIGGLTLFLQGATADINPDMDWEDDRAFDMVAEQGIRVAQSVLAAIESGSEKLTGNPLKIERAEVWLPTKTPVNTSRPPKNYGKPLMVMANLPGFLAIFADRLLNQR